MSLGVFIQVRLGSTRLPGKALLPLPGGTIIQHVMRSMSRVPAEVRALVTEAGSVEALSPLAREEGFLVFVGPRDDVLARYCMASREFAVDQVIRATGDNPLTSAVLAGSVFDHHVKSGSDLSHYLGIPLGTGVEVIRSESLFATEKEAAEPMEREHVTPFIYRHPDRFRIEEPLGPSGLRLSEAAVTVDTEEDYARVRRIFEELYRGEPIEADQLIGWLKSATSARGERA